MELRHLRYFVVLAEELHFGRAARRLSISQPPLSVAIRQLEETVGARLFERNSKEVRLTPAGEALRASARRLLRQAEEATREARDVARGAAGRLRIGFVGAMLYRGLPQALAKFQARHPAVRITLAELNSGEQIAELLHDRLDLGFVHTSRMPAELSHSLLLSEPFVLFSRSASPDYHERILAICAGAGFHPEVRHEVRHWLSVVSLVSQGMGVALVPSALQHAALRGAVFRPLVEEAARSDAYAVWRDGPDNMLVQRLLESFTRTAAPPPSPRTGPAASGSAPSSSRSSRTRGS